VSGWIGPLLALAALAAGVGAFVRLPPPQALAALVLSLAMALAMLRQFVLAAPLAMIGVNLWRRAGAQAAPSPGRRSQARTGRLAMSLDHDTGAMDGEVLEGAFLGRRLSTLSAGEVQNLLAELEAIGDTDSLSLLLAWLDRRGEPHAGPGREPPPSPPGSEPMTEAEALRLLGLEPGATREEIRAAHHRLMRRVHPDLGGSGALAAMINAAKERLDPG
jgi:hypothetical protein